jgi:curved DNA-binding protein CbpA
VSNDPYEILGVPRTASDDDIARAYRRRAAAKHPDRNQSATAHTEFCEVGDAYSRILNERKSRASRKVRAEEVALERRAAERRRVQEEREHAARLRVQQAGIELALKATTFVAKLAFVLATSDEPRRPRRRRARNWDPNVRQFRGSDGRFRGKR